MLEYEKALEKINNRLRFGIKPGLSRINKILEGLSNPHKKLKYMHVGGTNGKGSISTLAASALKENCYKTGLFTSPYVLEFRERFMINGKMIPKDELIEEVQRVAAVTDEIERGGDNVTEFEFITALAFDWFSRQGCDIVVLEVGLGGRFDCTNVIDTPEVAVLTSISLDHTAILGDTIEQIAFEKAGIIKENGSVVLYPFQKKEALDVFEKTAKEKNARIIIPDISDLEIISKNIDGTEFITEGERIFTPFLGEHQVYNAKTAHTALKVLKSKGFELDDNKTAKGFASAFIPARMEVVSKNPLIIIDGGHNPGCAIALKKSIQDFLEGKRLIGIAGMMGDKDVETTISILAPLFSEIVAVTPNQHRAMEAEALSDIAARYCKNVKNSKDLSKALDDSIKKLDSDSALIVMGSFYLATDARRLLKSKLDA